MTALTSPRATASRRKDTSRASRLGVLGEALRRPLADYYLILAPTVLLLGLGMLMVLSSSSLYAESIGQGPYSIAMKQVMFLAIGVPACWWLSRCGDRMLKALSWIAMAGSLALLLMVLAFGSDIKGNQSWLVIGPASLQPSEFAKLALVMFTAQVFSAKERVLDRPKEILPAVIGFVLIVGLIAAEHDLGTSLVVFAVFFAMVWSVGVQARLLFAAAGLGLLGVLVLVITSQNRMTRIFSFLGTNANDPNVSQQPLSSVYALASGGWWGLGLGASRQKWGALADGAQNDFVFAVLGEELGLVGVLTVLFLFAVIGWAGFRIALKSDSLFRRMLAAGCTSWLMFQALVNISVAMRMLPVVGVPLPFLSAGGSALLATMLAVGVLMSCARSEPAARRVLARRRGEPAPRVTTVVDAGEH